MLCLQVVRADGRCVDPPGRTVPVSRPGTSTLYLSLKVRRPAWQQWLAPRLCHSRPPLVGIRSVLDMLRQLPKDNCGYPLKHLFIGAEGTLGVVTKVALALAPLPTHTTVALAKLPSFAAVPWLLRRVRASAVNASLSAFEFLDASSIACMQAACGAVLSKVDLYPPCLIQSYTAFPPLSHLFPTSFQPLSHLSPINHGPGGRDVCDAARRRRGQRRVG